MVKWHVIMDIKGREWITPEGMRKYYGIAPQGPHKFWELKEVERLMAKSEKRQWNNGKN